MVHSVQGVCLRPHSVKNNNSRGARNLQVGLESSIVAMVVCAGSAEPHGQLPSAGLALAPLAPDCVTNAVTCVCTTFVGIAGTSIILNKAVTVTAVGTIRT